jgi:hypothetical protein
MTQEKRRPPKKKEGKDGMLLEKIERERVTGF